jgi:hypothetical protein
MWSVQVALGLRRAGRLRWRRVAGHERQAPAPVPEAVATRQRQIPFGDTTSPPQRSLASSAAIRLGPRPGWASEKARIRVSTWGGSWFGILGGRRSRGLSASRPQASTWRRQR